MPTRRSSRLKEKRLLAKSFKLSDVYMGNLLSDRRRSRRLLGRSKSKAQRAFDKYYALRRISLRRL